MELFQKLFSPRSIAVFGNANGERLGGRPLRNLIRYKFAGKIFPIDPKRDRVQGLPAYASIADIGEIVDQAVIALPSAQVRNAVEACGRKGVAVAQIISSGFADAGEEGRTLQDEVRETARRFNIHLLGPNSLGAITPAENFFPTFSGFLDQRAFDAGEVAFATQSGGMGTHAYSVAMGRGLGLSRGVCTGNEADITVADCISFFAEDPKTKVICVAIEGCTDGGALRDALLKAALAEKPVIVMKVGRSEAGVRAAATHTGSMAGEGRIFDVVLRECGAYSARSIEEMVDAAYYCAMAVLPANDKVACLSISGGIGVLMADSGADFELEVPPFPADCLQRLKDIAPYVSGVNPIDTTASIANDFSIFGRVLDEVCLGSGCGSVIIYLVHLARDPERWPQLQEAILGLRGRYPSLSFAAVLTTDDASRRWLDIEGIPSFEDPTRAMQSLAAAAKVASSRKIARHGLAGRGAVPEVAGTAYTLDEIQSALALEALGVPTNAAILCGTVDEARAAAKAMGYPVVAKIVSPDISHKTEVGGVALDIGDESALDASFERIVETVGARAPTAEIKGVAISQMARGGIELSIGLHQDPVFGPFVMFGLGGVLIEFVKDIQFASAPLSPAEADALINSTKASQLIDGWRGEPPCNRAILRSVLCAVSEVASQEASGIEINPFFLRGNDGFAIDAVVTKILS